MGKVKSAGKWIGFVASVLILTGCSTDSAVSTAAVIDVDITNVVLSNTSGDCADYSASYQAEVTDVKRNLPFTSQLDVSDSATSCTLTANDIPNYDFNDATANFADAVAEQTIALSVPRNPKLAENSTEFSLLTYNAVMLNGVVLDQLSNGCYKPDDSAADSNGNIANGCGPWVDWRLDPMGPVNFGTDSHNGHTQPGGSYHYHASPNALYEPKDTSKVSPVIGFAADGFPIFGPNYLDSKSGKILQATSGYALKAGSRATGGSSPRGSYDGTYIQDYEFTGVGTLDKCNGMTVKGQYGYYVTKSYPYVMGCFSGTPDLSFSKIPNLIIWIIGASTIGVLAIITAIVLVIRRRRKKSKKNTGITKEGI